VARNHPQTWAGKYASEQLNITQHTTYFLLAGDIFGGLLTHAEVLHMQWLPGREV
jgi:hypothetical protein